MRGQAGLSDYKISFANSPIVQPDPTQPELIARSETGFMFRKHKPIVPSPLAGEG